MSTLISNTEVQVENEFDLDVMSLSEFFSEYGYNKFNAKEGVRLTKDNKIPYITLLHESEKNDEGKTKAFNMYFTKKCTELGLCPEGAFDKTFFSNFNAVYAPCPAKDIYSGTDNKRKLVETGMEWKFCPKGEGGDYEDLANWL